MMTGNTRDKNQRGEQWKSLKKICRSLVDAVRNPAQWRNVIFASTRCPAVTALPAD
jgi:hypothetical protein